MCIVIRFLGQGRPAKRQLIGFRTWSAAFVDQTEPGRVVPDPTGRCTAAEHDSRQKTQFFGNLQNGYSDFRCTSQPGVETRIANNVLPDVT